MDITLAAQIASFTQEQRKGFAILLDPDKVSEKDLAEKVALGHTYHASFFMVGGSLVGDLSIQSLVQQLKSLTHLPVILFPGSSHQLVEDADALLLLSLISGRNPEFLIGKHVEVAPLLHKMELEVIPTGYLLVDSGKFTTAHYISNTLPIPYDKPDIAAYTALAGQYLGMKLIYLDGGSGAGKPLSQEMVAAVRALVRLPLMAGGGVKTSRDAIALWQAGADIVVLGSILEEDPSGNILQELVDYCDKPSITLP